MKAITSKNTPCIAMKKTWQIRFSTLVVYLLLSSISFALTTAGQTRVSRTQFMRDAKYGLFFHYLPGVTNIPEAKNPTTGYADSAQMNYATGRSIWAQTVQNFDATGFASDVAETGAGYVIFSLGQAGGYYCAPSYNYETATGTWRGEFTSTRDLIASVSDALALKGIKTMVYVASDGPAQAGPVKRLDSNGNYVGEFNPAQYLALLGQPSPARDPYFRQVFYNMIWQWSYDWGTKVSGWWFDGMVASSGWLDPNNASSAYNATTLINAARVGNPNAVIALNPGPDDYSIPNVGQDYTAGETGHDSTSNSRFWSFPSAHYKDDGYQWHFLSYLGSFWGKTDVRYDSNYLIDYNRYVNGPQAVVTYDLGITAGGRLYRSQVDQMIQIKNVVKGTTAPTTQSHYAIYKPAKCMNAAGTAEITPAIDWSKVNNTPSVVDKRYAINGNDGNYTTNTIGGDGNYAWTYQVDLVGVNQANQTKMIGTVNVIMPNTYYATQFNLEGAVSGSNPLLPGTTWANYKTFYTSNATTFTSGGVSYKKFTVIFSPRKSCRFLRVKAITPSLSSQGNQMAVSELEVYP
jgi:hypothetical protein